MSVLGTAGHIDHGKSTLIRALTGIDPDRLEEEKRRGMTIDLGFAHLVLPSGREVGIVDVPGHARFMRNMLAGVHGYDAVLLVVAADEGVMPQTAEHLEIVDLLGIRRGVVALTKADLVDDEWLAMVDAEVEERLASTSLAGAPRVPVSATTGAGLDRLLAALDERLGGSLEGPAAAGGPARLPVDRVFSVSGFGTVVTGTLSGAPLAVGDELEVVPLGLPVRVRGLQRHGRREGRVEPGNRVAVNISGVEREQLERGVQLARPGGLVAARRLDVQARVPPAAGRHLRHGVAVMVHAGTAEVPGRAVLLGADEIPPGGTGWVQLWLGAPLAAAAGDRLVLRLPSPPMTIAGAVVVDPAPLRHPRGDVAVTASLERRLGGGVLQEELAKYPRGVTADALLRASVAGASDLAGLDAVRAGDRLFAPAAWRQLGERAGRLVAGYHAQHPLRPGMPREELRSRLGLPAADFGAVLARLAGEGVVVERDGAVAHPDHRPAGEAGPAAAALLALLNRTPFSPPGLPDAQREAGAGEETVRALQRSGDIVRLTPDLALTREAYGRALEAVKRVAAAEGGVTVARLRDELGGSRRPLVAFLEHLDAQRITRRNGDVRTLRAPLP